MPAAAGGHFFLVSWVFMNFLTRKGDGKPVAAHSDTDLPPIHSSGELLELVWLKVFRHWHVSQNPVCPLTSHVMSGCLLELCAWDVREVPLNNTRDA